MSSRGRSVTRTASAFSPSTSFAGSTSRVFSRSVLSVIARVSWSMSAMSSHRAARRSLAIGGVHCRRGGSARRRGRRARRPCPRPHRPSSRRDIPRARPRPRPPGQPRTSSSPSSVFRFRPVPAQTQVDARSGGLPALLARPARRGSFWMMRSSSTTLAMRIRRSAIARWFSSS